MCVSVWVGAGLYLAHVCFSEGHSSRQLEYNDVKESFGTCTVHEHVFFNYFFFSNLTKENDTTMYMHEETSSSKGSLLSVRDGGPRSERE